MTQKNTCIHTSEALHSLIFFTYHYDLQVNYTKAVIGYERPVVEVNYPVVVIH